MQSASNSVDDVRAILEQMSEMVSDVEADDLPRLAKLHAHCESIIAKLDEQQDLEQEPLRDNIISLAQTLQNIIIGDEEDMDAAIVELQGMIANLCQTAAEGVIGDSHTDTDTSSTETSQSKQDAKAIESDEEVAAKLNKVFDDSSDNQTVSESTGDSSGPTGTPDFDAEKLASSLIESANGSVDETGYEPTPLSINPDEKEFVQAFVEEAGEHIEAIESSMLEVEQSPDDVEKINDLFRPFHTIKGMAGFLNLRDVNSLTHEAETLLDQGRKGERRITPGLIDLIFEVVDILKTQVAEIGNYLANPSGDVIPQPPVSKMIGRLRRVISGDSEPTGEAPPKCSPQAKVGENLVAMDAVSPVAVDAALEIQKDRGAGEKTGEILVEMGAATAREVSQAIRAQAQSQPSEEQSDDRDQQPQKAKATKAVLPDQSVRIETGKLDALVDMVGELVIAQALVSANDAVSEDPRLSKDVGQVVKIIRDVQETAMAMRMIPIKSTFQKMARLVRDLSRKAHKKVELIISGEETEMDKNVIQQIGDPLVHMVRNAIDHGLEPPDERVASGKGETGHIHLSAFHQGGNIVIEIKDDGRGLDPAKLVAKAIDKGIIQPSDELTDQQAFGLIFAPGFSTAAKVTDISGRGVGMDVVKRNIEDLRGRVDISSKTGTGSTFSIRLPLTLAIIDGMVVRVGSERYIIPTITIEQSLRPQRDQITTVQQRGEMLSVRGELVPLVQLGELFGSGRRVNPCDTMVVVAQCEERRVGLVVEELIGQQQVVIKTLGERFQGLRGISGAAILGDGRVGLILEMSGIEESYNETVTSLISDNHSWEADQSPSTVDTEPQGLELESAGTEEESEVPALV